MVHELKTWPIHFKDVASGYKKAEIRIDDRRYEVGDILILNEFDPDINEFTCQSCVRLVTHVLRGFEGLKEGYCMLSIETYNI